MKSLCILNSVLLWLIIIIEARKNGCVIVLTFKFMLHHNILPNSTPLPTRCHYVKGIMCIDWLKMLAQDREAYMGKIQADKTEYIFEQKNLTAVAKQSQH